MKRKKIYKVRILKKDSLNYTFIENVSTQTSDNNENDVKKKENQFVRNTLKDTKTEKIHYKSNNRSPKSQQNHSPVYE